MTFAGVAVDSIRAGASISTRIRGTFVVVDFTVGAPSAERTLALILAHQILAFALVLARILSALVDILENKGEVY